MKIIKIISLGTLSMLPLYAEISSIDDAFKQGKLEANLRLAYVNQHNHASTTPNTYATAIGGALKYETAKFNNISLAASAFVSQKISPFSGDNDKSELNGDLLGANGDSFAYMGEAYVNYASDEFNLRIGRQKIDTPMSDTDEIRMLPNTFEAFMAEFRGVENFVFTAGHIQRWAGYDSGNDISKFKDMPAINDSDGASLIGVSNDSLENIALQAWYYDFDKQAGVIYADAVYGAEYNSGISVESAVQYANYNEKSSSGVKGDAYGATLAIGYKGVTLGTAFSALDTPSGKTITLGYGGGPFYTSMEEMTIGAMNDAEAYVFSAQIDLSKIMLEGLNFAYAYGRFSGNDGVGNSVKTKENDFILAYALNENMDIEVSYAYVDDKANSAVINTGYDRFLVRANYSF